MGSGLTEKDSMFYYGETPWHSLGNPVDKALNAKEALEESGLNWDVVKVPLFTGDYQDEDITIPAGISVPGKYGMVRTDTMECIGDVGERYTPIQNVDAFDFFDEVVGQNEAMYHTAGSLFEGRKIWILAKLPDCIQIEGTDDITEEYMLLSNSHDGTSAIIAAMTPIRVVCNNTLTAAIKGMKHSITIRHTQSATGKIAEARKALGIAKNYYHELNDVLNSFAKYDVKAEDLTAFTEYLFPLSMKINDDGEEVEKLAKQSETKREKIVELFETGAGNEMAGIAGTAYAMLNSATEFSDHIRGTRVTEGVSGEDLRLNSVWFGSGSAFKQKAYSYIQELVNSKN